MNRLVVVTPGTNTKHTYMSSVMFSMLVALCVINVITSSVGQGADGPVKIKFLIVTENDQKQHQFMSWTSRAISAAEKTSNGRLLLSEQTISVQRDKEEESYDRCKSHIRSIHLENVKNHKWHCIYLMLTCLVCSILSSGISIILDLTYTGWHRCRDVANSFGLTYLRTDLTLQPYLRVLDDYLTQKHASDAVVIFQDDDEMTQGLYYLIADSLLRVIVLDKLTPKAVHGLREMRPTPSYFVIVANTSTMNTLFKLAIEGNVATRMDRWNFVFMDFKYDAFEFTRPPYITPNISLVTFSPIMCCRLLQLHAPCICPEDFQILPIALERMMAIITDTILNLPEEGKEIVGQNMNCKNINDTNVDISRTRDTLLDILKGKLNESESFYFNNDKLSLGYVLDMDVKVVSTEGEVKSLGNWTTNRLQPSLNGFQIKSGMEIVPTRRFFRIGTTEKIPWSYKKIDPETGKPLKDSKGKDIWAGYCLDLIKKLAEAMSFDYELVIPLNGTFGVKLPDGTWNGVVGDLSRGETDLVVAALTMTSEREEVIDYVAPYFEQSGISIVMRKPVRQTTLFKFMTVLRLEVWLSIVAALVSTGVMIWLLDKYSPYSARNNKEAYPYPCRKFTLNESFWFALTSFTPQGGGEAPKSLSARTLVAAYWLFVVLMLATFTANLAAFLTVERMQTPVQSLEQLARQSRINYTVVKESYVHEYFINMKYAEDTLYRVWKEITLNSTSDQTQYRVWDYPIREQYGHILLAINNSNPVATPDEGFRKVNDAEDANFAFIHDSSSIKYAISLNCNLTEVGEVFAEQPYAIAVQQGSHLQDDISRRILDLQKDRYFEALSSKFWNNSAKGVCPNMDDSEGITLESLGGVFIATLFGLVLAMVTLAGEVLYHNRKRNSSVSMVKPAKAPNDTGKPLKRSPIRKRVTIGSSFRPAAERVSHISVYPRARLHP